jgi:prevent-host-death family protein
MAATTVSIEELEQDANRVRKASENGPVFITEDGRPANVLLTIEEYRKLNGKEPTIVGLLSYPGAGGIEFEPPRLGTEEHRKLAGELPNIVDLLANPEGYDIEFDPPRLGTEPYRPVDLCD